MRDGGEWVHLRMCRICGHVGCCNSSENQHAQKHFHATGHPIIQSYEPGEKWGYDYTTDQEFDPFPKELATSERHSEGPEYKTEYSKPARKPVEAGRDDKGFVAFPPRKTVFNQTIGEFANRKRRFTDGT